MEKKITLGDEAIGNEVVVKRPSNYYQLLPEKSRPSCWIYKKTEGSFFFLFGMTRILLFKMVEIDYIR